MPELPEVETVRAGLARWVLGRPIAEVRVTHPRAVRRHPAGPEDLRDRLVGARFESAERRGKYLWLPLAGQDEALVAHLGMSGQLLVQPPSAPPEKHLHVRVRFADDGSELRLVDQRTFGGVQVDDLVGTGVDRVPAVVAHIGRDPFDPRYDLRAVVERTRTRSSQIKRVLLDQTMVSGIGNIYADEALWRAGVHWARPADALTRPRIATLYGHVSDVMGEALRAGGTSFDSLYVNVNGSSGYFERSLNVYGRAGEPCRRCGTAIRRAPFMNRSSYYCPRCQPVPRPRRAPGRRDDGI